MIARVTFSSMHRLTIGCFAFGWALLTVLSAMRADAAGSETASRKIQPTMAPLPSASLSSADLPAMTPLPSLPPLEQAPKATEDNPAGTDTPKPLVDRQSPPNFQEIPIPPLPATRPLPLEEKKNDTPIDLPAIDKTVVPAPTPAPTPANPTAPSRPAEPMLPMPTAEKSELDLPKPSSDLPLPAPAVQKPLEAPALNAEDATSPPPETSPLLGSQPPIPSLPSREKPTSKLGPLTIPALPGKVDADVSKPSMAQPLVPTMSVPSARRPTDTLPLLEEMYGTKEANVESLSPEEIEQDQRDFQTMKTAAALRKRLQHRYQKNEWPDYLSDPYRSTENRHLPLPLYRGDLEKDLLKEIRAGRMETAEAIAARLGGLASVPWEKRQETPLHAAVQSDQAAMVEWVLSVCPYLLNQANAQGETPWDQAYREHRSRVLAALKRHQPAASYGRMARGRGSHDREPKPSKGSSKKTASHAWTTPSKSSSEQAS